VNKIFLTGRWSKEIDLRYTPQGTAIAKSSIAVDDGWGDKKTTHFFEVEIWGKTAEATANYSGKGKKILVEGRLKLDSWEKDGQKRYAVKVVAEQVEFLEAKSQQDAEETGASKAKLDPFQHDSQPLDIDDKNLPF
jgi:single-strand DNA-binding protein